jgi:hypothetical protein
VQSIARRPLGAGIFVLAAMLIGVGACEVPALHGRVVDRETRGPVEDVRVVELWRAGRALSDVAATRLVRFAKTDREGRFAFPAESAAGVLRAERTPSYVLIHAGYGLVQAGAREPIGGALDFEVSHADVTALQALGALCESRPREEWEREIAAEICPLR